MDISATRGPSIQSTTGVPQVSFKTDAFETTTFLSEITEVIVSDTAAVRTLIIAILAVIGAITVLFLLAVFIDCRQQKIQNNRVKKSKKAMQNVIPKILRSHDRARIVENMHHQQDTAVPSYEVV